MSAQIDRKTLGKYLCLLLKIINFPLKFLHPPRRNVCLGETVATASMQFKNLLGTF